MLNIFPPYLNYGKKLFTQMVRFFNQNLPIEFTFLNDVAFTFGKNFENPEMFVTHT